MALLQSPFINFFIKFRTADRPFRLRSSNGSGRCTTASSKAHSALNQECSDRARIHPAKLQPVASSGVLRPFRLAAVSAGPVPAAGLNLGCSFYQACSNQMSL